MRRAAAIAALAFLAGCTTVGPVDQPQFVPMVEQATGISPGQIALSGRVSWRSTNIDYCWFANPSLNVHIQAAYINCTKEQIQNYDNVTREEPRDGILVVTDTEMTFMDWNAATGAYVRADSISISRISVLEIHRFGLSRLFRLTLRDSKFKYYTMTITGPHGQRQDREKNDLLFDHVRTRLPKTGKVATY
jgi:hypothetical protein